MVSGLAVEAAIFRSEVNADSLAQLLISTNLFGSWFIYLTLPRNTENPNASRVVIRSRCSASGNGKDMNAAVADTVSHSQCNINAELGQVWSEVGQLGTAFSEAYGAQNKNQIDFYRKI